MIPEGTDIDPLGIKAIGKVIKLRLFLTIEAQNSTENGLAKILWETTKELNFVTNRAKDLENENNYGTEFRSIAIIPSCMDDHFWNAFGWKERKLIWRKKGEADIRLRMDYDRFIKESAYNKRLLFIDIIVKSIEVVQERSKGDFEGERLIKDILLALNVSEEELNQLNT